VLYKVFGKIQEWTEWEAGGEAETVKRFIINTIVSYMISMINDNDVVHAIAPTGMSSFNIGGGGLRWYGLRRCLVNARA
jgi:hypothetical protein